MNALRTGRFKIIERQDETMRPVLTALSTVFFLFACSPNVALDQAIKLGQREFTPESWTTASRIDRGQMTASFLRQYDATALDRRQIEKILGPSTGYYYDNNPAYFVGPDTVTSVHGRGYLWVFEANKINGRIERVHFVPEVK